MPVSALLLGASVASLNLCTDEYLLLLARPQEVASVSYLSQDPLESPLWARARRHQANHGSIETVIRQRPSVLMTMGGGGRATGLIAKRLGIRTVEIRPVVGTRDVAANLRLVAEALGQPARAEPWVARLSALQRTAPRHAVDTIYLGGGGRSLQHDGPGAEWLRLAGLKQRPLPENRATLESLLVQPPAVLVESSYRRGQVSLGQRWLDHPIVRRTKARRVRTDGRAWTCMGPLLIAEVERLRGLPR